jgi:hypothetical protein
MNAQAPTNLTELSTSESYTRHQKQRFWQIIAPVGFGVLLILIILGLVISTAVGTGGAESVSQWADTSVIWLALPALLFALVLAVILFMMVWLLARLLKILPQYTMAAQYYAGVISDFIHTGADKLVAPIIAVKGYGATVSALMNALLGRRRD